MEAKDELDSALKNSKSFQRSFSSKIYSSIRRYKPNFRKSNKSKPFLTRLLLAEYEERFYLNGGLLNTTLYEEQKNKFLKEIEKTNQRKEILQAPVYRKVIRCDSQKEQQIEITLKINNETLNAIYMELLYIIIHRLCKEIDEDDEEEPIIVFKDSALEFVRDVFEKSEITHSNSLETLQKLQVLPDSPSKSISVSDKDFESYVNLLKIIIKYEIIHSKTPQNSWNGNFSFLSLKILSLHAEFLKLDKLTEFVARWVAFVDIHHQYRLNLKACCTLIQTICDLFSTQSNTQRTSGDAFFDKERYKVKFLESSESLSKSFTRLIEKIHKEGEKAENLENIFVIEKKTEAIRSESESEINFNEAIKVSLARGTKLHLMKKIESENLELFEGEKLLKEVAKILSFTIEHWKKISAKYSGTFESHCNFSFKEFLYRIYDIELANLIKPIVTKFFDSHETIEGNPSIELLKLYTQLSVIADHGIINYNINCNSESIGSFYEWFNFDAKIWNVVDAFKAHTKYDEKILSAINKDNLQPEDENSTEGLFSSSAFDTASIFVSIQDFWKNFKCSDEKIFKEIDKAVVTEICSATKLYFDKLSEKIIKLDSSNFAILMLPKEFFVAIANVNYLTKMTKSCIANFERSDLNFQDILKDYEVSAIQKILQLAFDRSSDKIKQEFDGHKKSKDCKLTDKLISHDLNTLLKLKHVKEIYKKILPLFNLVIKKLSLLELSPNYYKTLQNIFNSLNQIFEIDESWPEEILKSAEEICKILHFKGILTQDLIKQFRHEMNSGDSKALIGVHCYFEENILKLQILNVRNLNFVKSVKNLNIFVKISIEPKKYFSDIAEVKTKPQKESKCAVIFESFEFKLAKEQMNIINANLVLVIKEKNIIGRNGFMAETILSFGDIPKEKPKKLKQIDLKLTPPPEGHDVLEELKSRTNDKDAQNFLAKVNAKTSILRKQFIPKGFMSQMKLIN